MRRAACIVYGGWDGKLRSRRMRAASFALCVVRYKNKIKSITWQTTPHLCGNLLFLDCVCSRRRQSQRSRCKVKCIIFPFGGECDPFSKGHTERALLALCLNSQLSFLPLSLPARRSVELQFMKICVAGAASSGDGGWREKSHLGVWQRPCQPRPAS